MRIILLLIFLSISFSVSAQRGTLKQADKAYANMKYASAIPLYRKALKKDSLNVQATARLADCFRKLRDNQQAAAWYEKAVQLDGSSTAYQLHYAEALAGSGRYTEAAEWFGRHADDEKSSAFLASFKTLNTLLEDSASWRIGYLNMNSGYDDFCPVVFNRGLLFASNRGLTSAAGNVSEWDQAPYLNLFYVYDVSTLKSTANPEWPAGTERKYTRPGASSNDSRKVAAAHLPQQLPDNVKMLTHNEISLFNSQLQTKYHEGPVSLNKRQDTMYLTTNNYYRRKFKRDGEGVNRLKIYEAIYRYGDWLDAGEFPYNSDDYSTAHPALHPEGNFLYFVSDMPGGLGGKDIYYCVKTDSGWAAPKNAGPLVNTPGNEMFPYISPAGDLYFSSDGRGGLGGLDIFSIPLVAHVPEGTAKNIGYPVNSPGDDFGVWVNKDGFTGYFSSNRYGSDDVFSFSYAP